jgi:UDP-MurNAc hydroxylase
MKVTYIGHACILIESGGKHLLMDPWMVDPTYHGAWWHYPALVHEPKDLPKIDYLYISHEHPDHFDPPTLAQINKDAEILIADFRHKRFRDRIRACGFERITELSFAVPYPLAGSDMEVRLVPPDRPWDDSAILIKSNGTTVFNVNDCHLDDTTLARIGEEEKVDLAFLTFTGASQYPGCFDFPESVKIERWQASKRAHAEEFVNWARLLKTKRAVPAAGNFALLAEEQLPLNTSHYVNTPKDAIDLLLAHAPEVEGLQMNPGDVWTPEGGHQRLNPAPDWSRREEEIAAMARAKRHEAEKYFNSEAPAPPDLFERFQAYFGGLLAADKSVAERVNIVTQWEVTGDHGGKWVIDFTRDRDWVYAGEVDNWNLRLRVPSQIVAAGVSGDAIWDNLVLSFRFRLARNPDIYMREFWTWLCKL